MERDAIALAVDDDRAMAVRPDRMRRLQHAAAVRSDGALGIDDAAVDVEVDERAAERRPGVAARRNEAAADLAASVGEDGEREAGAALARHLAAEDGAIEPDRALEVGDRDVDPDEAVAHGGLLVAALRSGGPFSSTTLPSGSRM